MYGHEVGLLAPLETRNPSSHFRVRVVNSPRRKALRSAFQLDQLFRLKDRRTFAVCPRKAPATETITAANVIAGFNPGSKWTCWDRRERFPAVWGSTDEILTWEDENMRDSYRLVHDGLSWGLRYVHAAVTQ